MSFLFIEFNFCPREQRKSNCENHFHMFMLLSAEKLRNSYYYQIIQKKFFNLFFWHFLWWHAFNQVYNSDKTFPIHNEFSSGVPAWAIILQSFGFSQKFNNVYQYCKHMICDSIYLFFFLNIQPLSLSLCWETRWAIGINDFVLDACLQLWSYIVDKLKYINTW